MNQDEEEITGPSLQLFNEVYEQHVKNLFDSIDGFKFLFIDKQLIRYLKDLINNCESIAKETYQSPVTLSSYNTQLNMSLPDYIKSNEANIIYIIRPEVHTLQIVIDQINMYLKRNTSIEYNYHIYFVPRMTKLCTLLLEQEELYPQIVSCNILPIEMIPIEKDIMSLELLHSYKDLFLDGDITILYYIAKSLMKIQDTFGNFHTIKGKGDYSYQIYQLMQNFKKQKQALHHDQNNLSHPLHMNTITNLILLDRSVDMITPLLTQGTYEGLIDEFFTIKNSRIIVDEYITGGKGNGRREHLLNNADVLFSEIRNFNFRVLGPYLHNKAASIKDTYSERHEAKSVNEMHKFIRKFKSAHSEHTFLQTHINLAEYISKTTRTVQFDTKMDIEQFALSSEEYTMIEEYIISSIAKQVSYTSVLRLICLLALTNGIKKSKYEFIKREFIHSYGYEMLFTFQNLEKLGLLNSDYYKFYQTIRKQLKLIKKRSNQNHNEYHDISLVIMVIHH